MDEVSTSHCQLCDVEFDSLAENKRMDDLKLPWDMDTRRFNCCSFECLIKGHRVNAVVQFISMARNFSATSFEAFKDWFDFPEEGGYAADKYKLARTHPWVFICSLSSDKIINLARKRRI